VIKRDLLRGKRLPGALLISARLVTAICLLLIPTVMSAQKSADAGVHGKLTLAQAIDLARSNYPAIRASQEQQQAAAGAIGIAKTAYLPRADVLWQTNRATANNVYGLLLPQGVISSISGPVIASDVSHTAWSSAGGALLNWQPFDFGARGAKVHAARQGNEAAKQASALTMLQVTAGAGSAFFDLAAAQQLVVVAQANVKRLEAFDKATHVLVENMLRPGADGSQADAQLALGRTQLIQAQTQEAIRRAALAEYLQVTGAQPEVDASQMSAALPPSDPDAGKAIAHPAVVEESALVGQQEAQEHVLDRSYVPVFNILGGVSGRGVGTNMNGHFPGGTAGLAPDTFNWAAGVQVTFSAFDYFGLREEKKVQRATIQAEQARYAQAVDDVSAAVEQARATLAGARQVAANTPVELAAARVSEQQQQARYRSALATVVDVAAAEAVLAQAESDDAIARLSVWRAELGVAAAQGDLQPFLQMLESQP
jgi:outer membrane protein